MKKRLLAFMMALTMLLTLLPVGAMADEVWQRIDAISKEARFAPGSTVFGSEGCWRFCNEVSQRVFGVGIPNDPNGYQLTGISTNSNWNTVGMVANSSATNAAVTELLKRSIPGDIIQYKCSYATWQHTAMIYAVSDWGISIYDSTHQGVRIESYPWSQVASTSGIGNFGGISGYGLSLYRCIYSGTPATPSTVSFTVNNVENLTNTTAKISCQCYYSGTRPTSVGYYIGTSSGSIAKAQQVDTLKPTGTNNPVDVWYNLSSLTPGTTYYYKFFAIVNGTEHTSGTYSFNTSAPVNPVTVIKKTECSYEVDPDYIEETFSSITSREPLHIAFFSPYISFTTKYEMSDGTAYYFHPDSNGGYFCRINPKNVQVLHNYSEKVTKSTCTAQGYTTYTCSCGDSYKGNYTSALGHNWDNGKVTKQPTETSTGVRTYTCTRCTATKTETIPALTHTHSYTTAVTAPTCTAQGYTTHTCACGDSYKDTYVAALGHNYKDGKCTRCGAADPNYQPSHTHSYTTAVTAPTCTAQGYTTHTCACGDSYKGSYTDALGHNYSGGFCTRCGARDPGHSSSHVHSYTDTVTRPTCTEKGFTTHSCSCGDSYKDSYVPALGHDYKNGVCTRCGADDPDEKQTQEIKLIDIDGLIDSFKESIKWAVEKGITTGYSDNTFRPNATCTRGHVVTFLWRAAGSPEPKSINNPFSDVSSDSPFYKAILWAAEQGITGGYADGTFRPNDACTRAHVVTFLWRYEGKPAASGSVDLTDLGGLNKDFTAAIQWAATSGITTGYSDGTFRPNAVCTRAHVVTFLYRDIEN